MPPHLHGAHAVTRRCANARPAPSPHSIVRHHLVPAGADALRIPPPPIPVHTVAEPAPRRRWSTFAVMATVLFGFAVSLAAYQAARHDAPPHPTLAARLGR